MAQVMTAAPAWTIPGFLEVREGRLYISGADAVELAREHGSPLFVFSEPRIRANIARLQTAAKQVDRPIKFCYASKANSNMAVLGVVREAGIDIEVNSAVCKPRCERVPISGTSRSAIRAGGSSVLSSARARRTASSTNSIS
jgi:hypothetical protein